MLFGNDYKNLFLQRLSDDNDNELTIFITQSKKIETSSISLEDEENEKVRELLSTTMQLVSDDMQTYRIYFESYIIYQGRNESYAYNDNDHISAGKGLVLFEKSKLLDYVNDVMDIPLAKIMQQKNKLQHYGIYTLNNIIDVITLCEPVIEKVNHIA